MAKLLSGRLQRLNLGITSVTENNLVLDVIGGANISGITTLASSGGITTTGGDLYVGGNLYVGDDIVFDEVTGRGFTVTGYISAGSTTGTEGQYLQSTGVGVTWASFPTLRTENSFTATTSQTTFNVNYNVGFVDVYFNGVRLTDSEYTASDGTSIVINEECFGGETVDILSYNVTSNGSGGGGDSESDTLDSVTGRGNTTANSVTVGILSATNSVYADTIRRRTDNSTNTKISLDAGSLKFYAGNGVSPKVTVNGGVGINTNLNVTGVTTASSFVKSGGTSSQFLKADGSVDTSTYATSVEDSWTVTAGVGTYSFTVPQNGNYVMWMRGNIPNGICVWNATVSITNNNVPVLGNQYGWYYAEGNQLVLTSIPSQIIGTSGSISTTSPGVINTNTFSFGITNNSDSSQTVHYGYTTI
jgi:hypothetical protein